MRKGGKVSYLYIYILTNNGIVTFYTLIKVPGWLTPSKAIQETRLCLLAALFHISYLCVDSSRVALKIHFCSTLRMPLKIVNRSQNELNIVLKVPKAKATLPNLGGGKKKETLSLHVWSCLPVLHRISIPYESYRLIKSKYCPSLTWRQCNIAGKKKKYFLPKQNL